MARAIGTVTIGVYGNFLGMTLPKSKAITVTTVDMKAGAPHFKDGKLWVEVKCKTKRHKFNTILCRLWGLAMGCINNSFGICSGEMMFHEKVWHG